MLVDVTIETPRGSRNKYTFDEKKTQFKLGTVLPAGMSFPYDFGFVPQTRCDDGDPIDVLVLMDESAFPGCIVTSRLIGVLEAEQTEAGKTLRNDRLVAVADPARNYRDLHSLRDVNKHVLLELEHFFVSYNEMKGERFTLLAAHGPNSAWKLLRQSVRTAQTPEE